MNEVLNKFLEKFKRDENKAVIEAFTGILEAMNSNIIYRLANLILTIRLDCRRLIIKKCCGQRYRLLDAPMITRNLFPEPALDDFMDKCGTSQIRFKTQKFQNKPKWKGKFLKNTYKKKKFFPKGSPSGAREEVSFKKSFKRVRGKSRRGASSSKNE